MMWLTTRSTTSSGVLAAATVSVAWALWQRKRQRLLGSTRPLTRLPSDCSASQIVAALHRDGAVIVENVAARATMAQLSDDVAALSGTEYAGAEDSFAGSRTFRCGPYVLEHSQTARALASHPLVVTSAQGLLARVASRIRLSVVVCIRVLTGQCAQELHRDDEEWPLALLGSLKPGLEVELSAMWAVSDFTVENGATNVVLGSHGGHEAEHGGVKPEAPPRESAQSATMKAGSILFFTGSVWHGAGSSCDADSAGGSCASSASMQTTAERGRGRQGFLCQYIPGWLHPEHNLHFAVPPTVSAGFTEPALRDLLGHAGPELFAGPLGAPPFAGPLYATEYTGFPDRTDADFSKALS
jgi:ectoine hydroxylase-related dioxygenase (phytanoyl-CoA dioxygenase family)